MQKQYSENNLSGHISNIELRPYDNGFVISSGNDEIAIYNEFGTGIVGMAQSNPLASDAKYEYNVNSPHKGVIPEAAYYTYTREYLEAVNTPDTWWYFKNGKWWHTEGMKAKNMYSSLVEELRDNAKEQYRTKIKQKIGDYNSGGK